MANSYFKFKQFTIHQDRCAMKVTTDACLFGAWIADILYKKKIKYEKILDIGAGTGLLTLMVAQKSAAYYNAIEIDKGAYEQCVQNFQNAKMEASLTVKVCDAADFRDEKKYQLIISNPPFFENDLPSLTETKNIAKHSAGLNFEELLNCVTSNLSDEGFFAVLLPYHRTEIFERLAAKKGLFLSKKTQVKQTPKHHYFRSMLLFSKVQSNKVKERTIIIEMERGKYTEDFVVLLKDYYLHL